jgi:hypothetical protein
MAENVHQGDQLAGNGADIVGAKGLVGSAETAGLRDDDVPVAREDRHDAPPRIPGLRPAADEQHRGPLASPQHMQTNVPDPHALASECPPEVGREIF